MKICHFHEAELTLTIMLYGWHGRRGYCHNCSGFFEFNILFSRHQKMTLLTQSATLNALFSICVWLCMHHHFVTLCEFIHLIFLFLFFRLSVFRETEIFCWLWGNPLRFDSGSFVIWCYFYYYNYISLWIWCTILHLFCMLEWWLLCDGIGHDL